MGGVEGALARAADRAAADVVDGARRLGARTSVDGRALLVRRRRRPGATVSAGGASRLLRVVDGWIAVTLARPCDVALVPAWLGAESRAGGPWPSIAAAVRDRPAAGVVERAQLLGIPAAVAVTPAAAASDEQARARGQSFPFAATLATRRGPARRRRSRPPVVVDLSSLWAGPLCTRLLADAGALVVDVESAARPDPGRDVHAELHRGKERVVLDLDRAAGRTRLHALLEQADVVVEASRPRALDQLAVDRDAVVAGGAVWVAISGYGRTGPWANRVAFGDDAGVAGGLAAAAAGADGRPRFVGDAVADPLTGLHAAAATLGALAAREAQLIDVAMREVAGHALAAGSVA